MNKKIILCLSLLMLMSSCTNDSSSTSVTCCTFPYESDLIMYESNTDDNIDDLKKISPMPPEEGYKFFQLKSDKYYVIALNIYNVIGSIPAESELEIKHSEEISLSRIYDKNDVNGKLEEYNYYAISPLIDKACSEIVFDLNFSISRCIVQYL